MTRMIAALLVLGLCVILVIQWLGWSAADHAPNAGTEMAPVAAQSSEPEQPQLLARLESTAPKESYSSIIEHPLFRPDRKPEPPEEEEPEPEAPEAVNQELDSADLTAVLISPAVVSAWVKDPSKPRLQRLRIGDDFLGWSVQDILEDRVVLERQGEQDTLILRDYSKTPPASPPKPARMPVPRRPSRPPPPPKQ